MDFRITSYADRLIQDLSLVDWPDAIKQMQTHWIGKSEGGSVCLHWKKIRPKKSKFSPHVRIHCSEQHSWPWPAHPLVENHDTRKKKAVVEIAKHHGRRG
jgi:leucyl-tRNA synthetase